MAWHLNWASFFSPSYITPHNISHRCSELRYLVVEPFYISSFWVHPYQDTIVLVSALLVYLGEVSTKAYL